MTTEHQLAAGDFELNGEVYSLLDLGGGRVQWLSQPVPGQVGDSTQLKPYPVELHGGFGASHRIRRGNGSSSDPAHHAYAENVMGMFEGILYPSPRITYVDGSAFVQATDSFEVGGDGEASVGLIGGGGAATGSSAASAPVGGGSYDEVPQYIREFGDYLYVHAGPNSLVLDIDQATPVFVEGTNHGASARARKSDVFQGSLAVALGAGEEMVFATSPYTGASGTDWTEGPVAREVVTVGAGGRMFTSLANKVYNVLPDGNPLISAAYLPSNGEAITDTSNPVRSLIEYLSALIAGTARGARTLDPNRGYQGAPITAESRLSASDYDGRAMLTIGPLAFYATSRGVQMIRQGQPPLAVGPEVLNHNDTPYKGMEWGIPDYLGDWMAWPAYIPETGDSVIFFARVRDQEDIGTGPVVWHDALFLDGRESRCVRLWGGTASRGPRLVFGAGTAAVPYQVGWCDLGKDGGPDPFTSDGQPALSGFIETPLDDMGVPGVVKSFSHVEVPYLHNGDANNYLVVQGRAGHDGALVNFVKAQTGSNQERLNTEGFQRVFAQTGAQLAAAELALRFTFTQASGATVTEWLMAHGTIMAYYSEAPKTVQLIKCLVDAKTRDHAQAEAKADTLRALIAGGHVRQRFGPDGADRWVRVTDAKVTTGEVNSDTPAAATRLAIELTMREVMTS